MIQTVVTPQKANFDMAVSLPEDYVGKEVHVLFYIDEETKKPKLRYHQQKNHRIFLVRLVLRKEKKCKPIYSKVVTNGKEVSD